MQRKRKLTAAFCEIPEEKEKLQRSWRGCEHSDWTLVLGQEEYAIHKVILATGERASAFLAASFRKHCGQQLERTDLTELVPRHCWPHFEAVLDFVYSGQVNITVESWGPMVKMADLLQIGALYTRCVEVGSDLITAETAPRIVTDAVELELGGELRDEVVGICTEVMVPCFSSYQVKDLRRVPIQVFKAILRRNDLEVTNEDEVLEFLLKLGSELGQADMIELWKCCRLHCLSPERILEVALVNEIPKQAVVWALAQRSSPIPRSTPLPAWTAGWADASACSSRGREITFSIEQPSLYGNKKDLRSVAHQLCDRFKWRLLIFPLGTETTGSPKQAAAFVEMVPEADVDPRWKFKRVKYSITLINWNDERRSITKDHVFDFSALEVDNGWHKGWVTPDTVSSGQGWLSDSGKLVFRAKCDVRNAVMENVDPVVGGTGNQGTDATQRPTPPRA
mmetsp:Transcript_17956/g.38289  ORF Transcript_17956/g.38289 Transcript_17956/m.38289 type:complete len:452 (-) Transcript_17956:62-1417(-)